MLRKEYNRKIENKLKKKKGLVLDWHYIDNRHIYTYIQYIYKRLKAVDDGRKNERRSKKISDLVTQSI